MKNNNLILDLGLHIGQDTEFYLKKGFNVVAIEANPELCEEANDKFYSFIKSGQLHLINKAVSNNNEKLKFYIHPTQKDWSSCFKEFIRSENVELTEIEVEGITIKELFEQYNVPRYMKVDIEGADGLVAKQLSFLKEKPDFVSFETSRSNYAEIFSYLFLAGYKKFQLINQLKYNGLYLENIKNEGKNLSHCFELGSSGIFGLDLDETKWVDYTEVISRYNRFIDLRNIDQENLSMGWIDIHAKF